MTTKYSSGEEIQPGDRIVYLDEPGQVEFVATEGDPETGWYVEELGGGCIILVPSFDQDLEFVARNVPPSMS